MLFLPVWEEDRLVDQSLSVKQMGEDELGTVLNSSSHLSLRFSFIGISELTSERHKRLEQSFHVWQFVPNNRLLNELFCFLFGLFEGGRGSDLFFQHALVLTVWSTPTVVG